MNLDEALRKVTKGSTNKWAKVRKAEERCSSRMFSRSRYMYSDRVYIKEVAYKVMEEAYMKASKGGTLPTNARQIMYAARPLILAESTQNKFTTSYFTQKVLPMYVEEHPEKTANWNVVFDARGHLYEPHTGKKVNLGTIEVRNYIHEAKHYIVDDLDIPTVDGGDKYPTKGPENRYSAIMFIEKEGFQPLFDSVELADKYDICIMSTKGLSTTAARELVDELCVDDITLFVLHDFDKSGFSIVSTLQRDTDRYCFRHNVNVVDMGLQLEQVKKYNLQSEPVSYGKSNPCWNLVENGATAAEIDFLCDNKGYRYSGHRVELNALDSGQLLDLITTTLDKHKIKKVVPDNETLEAAYHRATLAYKLNAKLEEVVEEFKKDSDSAEVKPEQIKSKIKRMLKKTPTMSWDDAMREIVKNNLEKSTKVVLE